MSEETKAFGEILNGLRGDFSQIALWDDLKKRIKDKGHFREFNALCFLTWTVLRCTREGKR